MSSTVEIQLVIQGEAVASGAIDAQVLATSLIGYSAIFNRANHVANGDQSKAAVLVQSEFKSGSFIVHLTLVQDLIQQTQAVLATNELFSAGGLATLIGFVAQNRDSLIELWKWLKGTKPEKVVEVGNNRVQITIGQDKRDFSKPVFNFYGDSAIRAAFGQAVAPLRCEGVDRIAIKHGDSEQMAIEKSEAEYFEPELVELQPDSSPEGGERETVLIVSKLSFTEGSTWTFFERGATLVAKIEDEAFWREVHAHKRTFGEGDRLRIRLRWNIEPNRRGKLVARNVIVKVYGVDENPEQLNLGRD